MVDLNDFSPEELADALARSLSDQARELADKRGTTEWSACASIARRLIQASYGAGIEGRKATDSRTRPWLVSVHLTHTDQNNAIVDEAMSAGRVHEQDGKGYVTPIKYGGDIVTGLYGAAELISEYVEAFAGTPLPEFSTAQLMTALNNLRPTLSRQAGYATLRRVSMCGRYQVTANIFREDAMPDEAR